MDSAEPDPSLVPGSVGMCYVVVMAGEPGQAPDDLRVRFEFRDDLTSGRSESRTVLGVGAACEEMRDWLAADRQLTPKIVAGLAQPAR